MIKKERKKHPVRIGPCSFYPRRKSSAQGSWFLFGSGFGEFRIRFKPKLFITMLHIPRNLVYIYVKNMYYCSTFPVLVHTNLSVPMSLQAPDHNTYLIQLTRLGNLGDPIRYDSTMVKSIQIISLAMHSTTDLVTIIPVSNSTSPSPVSVLRASFPIRIIPFRLLRPRTFFPPASGPMGLYTRKLGLIFVI